MNTVVENKNTKNRKKLYKYKDEVIEAMKEALILSNDPNTKTYDSFEDLLLEVKESL